MRITLRNISRSISINIMSTTLVDLHACGICFQLYNDSDRLPKVLSCGHTNCLTCLSRGLKHGSSPFSTCAVCCRVTHRPVHLLIHDFLALESDTPPHAYLDFSLLGSESSHETAVSASETSSQANENFSSANPPREDAGFSHISTVSGDFGTYSYCELCQCRISASRNGHRTYILGRRHQHARLGNICMTHLTVALSQMLLERYSAEACDHRIRDVPGILIAARTSERTGGLRLKIGQQQEARQRAESSDIVG
ncbi:unnamed protein product [Heligmosomoides polygyrus]|uniref:RING-type domain-containing protein n=1 Tax=Heligmosomoides polygyrus TaxID=6339 RepID=A0A3P8GXN0_HELPZ|nr:unnamed protein product [Heligmosomoides polygyrus]